MLKMKFKKSSLKSVSIIFFVVCILFITGSLAVIIDEKVKVDTEIKYDNKVKTNNSFFELQWDFDTTGYGADGRFYLKSSDFKSLDKNRTVYIGLITPSLINNNNEVSITQAENIKNVVTKSFFCDTNKYGWEVFNQEIWCNSTFSKINNITFINESYDIKTLYTVTSNNNLVINTNNLTVFYNITTFSKQNIKTDLSVSFIKIEQKDIKTYLKKLDKDFTDLGNNLALINIPINLTQNEVNILELKLDVPKNLLPLKYSVVIIDIDDNSYIIIDPTIVNARTWSNNNDFTNGTTLTNVSTSASGITLTPASAGSDTFVFGDDFNDASINISLWVNSGCTETTFLECIDTKYLKSVDLSASPFLFNSSQYFNLSMLGNNTIKKRDCFVLQDDVLEISADSNCALLDDKIGLYSAQSVAHLLLPQKFTANVNPNPFNLTTETYSFNFIHNSTGYFHIKDGVILDFTANNTVNNLKYWIIGDPQTDQQGGTIAMDNFKLQYLAIPISAKTHGLFTDQEWSPQSNSQITNITITADNSSGGNFRFRANTTSASRDTSDWIILANGTQNINLNFGYENSIFYQFDMNNTGTGEIKSWTINEATTSSCNYGAGTWKIQGSENCGLNTTAMSGNNIIFNGTGQARILSNQRISNCGSVQVLQTAVGVHSGAKLCS